MRMTRWHISVCAGLTCRLLDGCQFWCGLPVAIVEISVSRDSLGEEGGGVQVFRNGGREPGWADKRVRESLTSSGWIHCKFYMVLQEEDEGQPSTFLKIKHSARQICINLINTQIKCDLKGISRAWMIENIRCGSDCGNPPRSPLLSL